MLSQSVNSLNVAKCGCCRYQAQAGIVKVSIDSVRVSPVNYQRVIVLKEDLSDRYLPIWIGPAEADSIAVKLQDLEVPRPLTHDLLRNTIDAVGGSVRHVVVNDLQDDTFYAKIVVEVRGETMQIDSRPADAMALAVRAEAAIFVEESVMDKASIKMDKETGKPIPPKPEATTPVDIGSVEAEAIPEPD